MIALVASGGCAAGDTNNGRRDGGDGGGSMDASGADGGTTDPDTGVPPMPDAGTDSGMMIDRRGTCEACEAHADCQPGAFCISLTVGGRACVPGCNPDIPTCPRAFNCVLDVASGVDSTVCLPVGGACCVDEDADTYGQGVGCMGADCDDADDAINPGASEICNGIDDDCDGMDDDPPTDCLSGRCSAVGDGTYESVSGADCVSAECSAGTTTPCGEFTCIDGGESGNTCAVDCAPMGTDDDTFCIASAHCDAGACVPDEPNGTGCNEDSDCIADHCDNGFCCGMGTCCSTTADCPGGGGVTLLCETPTQCQGSRGETMCMDSQCRTTAGIPDDTACGTTTEALSCGLYDPVFCTGATDQPTPSCPTSCTGDAACIEEAHCDFGDCVRDRPPGASCSRAQDCEAGLFCIDGVCCTSSCTGTCEACNIIGSAGSCTAVPAMADPSGECPGFSCASYFNGFSPGEDVCYRRQDVSDSTASCNGARACISPATLCPLQPRGSVQIDCHNTCQAPVTGTCSGMTSGACSDLDNPGDLTTCGTGACQRSVQRCIGGLPQTCSPGSPMVETCNGIDDNCNGTPDDGTGSSLCPAAPNVAAYSCSAGMCSFTCGSNYHDINSTYADGCECQDTGGGNSCGAATSLGDFGTTTPDRLVTGTIVPASEEDWYSINFPSSGRGPGQGAPSIQLPASHAPNANFRLDFFTACGSGISCGTGTSSGIDRWIFQDNVVTTFAGPHSVAWPVTVYFRVRRIVAVTACADATYQITISR